MTARWHASVSRKSFEAVLTVGKGIAIPDESAGQMRANCEVIALQNVPAGGIKVEWLAGCIAGTIVGQIVAIQSNGG